MESKLAHRADWPIGSMLVIDSPSRVRVIQTETSLTVVVDSETVLKITNIPPRADLGLTVEHPRSIVVAVDDPIEIDTVLGRVWLTTAANDEEEFIAVHFPESMKLATADSVTVAVPGEEVL